MKKVLLSLACASAMVAPAQVTSIKKEASAVIASSKIEVAKNAVLSSSKMSKAPQRMAADGVYYKTPAGAMWNFSERPLYAYNTPGLVVAPWTDFTYVNMSEKKNGTWGLQTSATFIDLTDDTDEANNLISSYNGGAAAYYAPQYTEGGITYIPTADAGEKMANYVDDVKLHAFHPSNVGSPSYYGRGSLDNENLYGAGTFTNGTSGESFVSLGIDMSYPKPMSPLYVDKVTIWGILQDASKGALSGKTLTMQIFNLEDENAEPVVLTCTPEECVLDRETTNGGYFYQVNFTQKTVDEISGETVAAPFVIDYPTEVIITGFEQEGVNLGLMGYDVFEEFKSDNENENITYLVLRTATGELRFLRYPDTVVALGFQSMFDICTVDTEIKSTDGQAYEANGIAVSADGQTFGNNIFSDVNGVQVYTALAWTDATTGEEMYWSDDMYDYDWIQNLVVESTKNQSGREIGHHHIGAVCDPLPAGTDKRYAVIHLNGRGVTSEDIYVLQGNITLEEAKADHAITAIADVKNDAAKKNNKKFNLAGQQVDNNFKGIVISNGKKAIMK